MAGGVGQRWGDGARPLKSPFYTSTAAKAIPTEFTSHPIPRAAALLDF